jgi:hypothetical protein
MARPREPHYRPTLPVKLDVRDPKERAWLNNNAPIRILLDGVEQQRVLSFDTKEGTLTRYVVDPETNRIVLDGKRGIGKTEDLSGIVKVEWQ